MMNWTGAPKETLSAVALRAFRSPVSGLATMLASIAGDLGSPVAAAHLVPPDPEAVELLAAGGPRAAVLGPPGRTGNVAGGDHVREVTAELAARGGVSGAMAEIAPWSAFGHTMSTAVLLDGSIACLVSVATQEELDPAQLGHSTAAVGLLAQMIVLRRDVERLRQELHDLQQDRSLLTAGLHHDLKGPLTSILGSARTLIARYEMLDDGLRMDLLEGIASQSERLNRMLTETLDRQSSDPNAPVRRMKADLRELTERVASAAMNGRDGDVVVECEPLSIVTDPDRLERALLNLLDNALKYSPSGTSTYLIVEHEGGSVSMTVADNGPGVSPDVLPGLFSPYATDPSRRDGTGLGLHSVRQLVEELGGRVGYSRHSGWSRFTMTLSAEDEGDVDRHA